MRNYDSDKFHRRSIRLGGYDYSQDGSYFVTICTQHRLCLFGDVVLKKMILNDAGKMIKQEWNKLSQRFSFVQLSSFVIMLNHFHGILELSSSDVCENELDCMPDASQGQNIQSTVGCIIGAFKSITTNLYIEGVRKHQWSAFYKRLWQRNFYEHIIRDQRAYDSIVRYIRSNPEKWRDDLYFAQDSESIPKG